MCCDVNYDIYEEDKKDCREVKKNIITNSYNNLIVKEMFQGSNFTYAIVSASRRL